MLLLHRISLLKIQCTTSLEVIVIIVRPFTYESKLQLISGKRCEIRIENLFPVLTEEERVEQLRCIEEGLFDIYIKYSEHRGKMNDRCGAAVV